MSSRTGLGFPKKPPASLAFAVAPTPRAEPSPRPSVHHEDEEVIGLKDVKAVHWEGVKPKGAKITAPMTNITRAAKKWQK